MTTDTEEVRRLAANPNEDEYASLLVTAEAERGGAVADRIRAIDGCHTVDQLGFDVLRVIVEQPTVEDLTAVSDIIDIEVERKLRVLPRGN